jgi:hypothetical protein
MSERRSYSEVDCEGCGARLMICIGEVGATRSSQAAVTCPACGRETAVPSPPSDPSRAQLLGFGRGDGAASLTRDRAQKDNAS